jgi:hypothetical protein
MAKESIMKSLLRSVTLATAFTVLAGCTTVDRGPAYGHEKEFRRQVADSEPVRDFGYKILSITFSEDFRKARLALAEPRDAGVRQVVLEDDGFRRYTATNWVLVDSISPMKAHVMSIAVSFSDK